MSEAFSVPDECYGGTHSIFLMYLIYTNVTYLVTFLSGLIGFGNMSVISMCHLLDPHSWVIIHCWPASSLSLSGLFSIDLVSKLSFV